MRRVSGIKKGKVVEEGMRDKTRRSGVEWESGEGGREKGNAGEGRGGGVWDSTRMYRIINKA